MGQTVESDTAVLDEGIIPPEFAANLIKHVVDGDVVRIWFYSRMDDPLSPKQATNVRVAVITVPAKVFDAFVAERLVRVAEKIVDGHATPPTSVAA